MLLPLERVRLVELSLTSVSSWLFSFDFCSLHVAVVMASTLVLSVLDVGVMLENAAFCPGSEVWAVAEAGTIAGVTGTSVATWPLALSTACIVSAQEAFGDINEREEDFDEGREGKRGTGRRQTMEGTLVNWEK